MAITKASVTVMDIASQAEAQAGTADDVVMTPERTAEAITALETATADIASQAEAEAGTNNTDMMTPLRTAQAIAALESNPFGAALLHVREEQTSGTNGGTFTQDAWQTRVLNQSKTNEITGASLASNQITLPAGTYYVEASAPAYDVAQHKLKLRDVTNSADLVIGQNAHVSAADDSTTTASASGRFTLGSETVLELQHYCTTTKATTGFGNACSFSVVEVYADVKIWQIS